MEVDEGASDTSNVEEAVDVEDSENVEVSTETKEHSAEWRKRPDKALSEGRVVFIRLNLFLLGLLVPL